MTWNPNRFRATLRNGSLRKRAIDFRSKSRIAGPTSDIFGARRECTANCDHRDTGWQLTRTHWPAWSAGISGRTRQPAPTYRGLNWGFQNFASTGVRGTMPKPFVSVLIDTYNHERFIEQAIVSVLEQDFPATEREIIVVDDGSADRTPEIVRKFEPHVRLLRKENGGQASAFNAGIPECKGEIIAFLDGDDWWAPGKLQAVASAFASDGAIGLIGHGITEVFSDGSEHAQLLKEVPRFRADSETGARAFRLRKSFLGTSRMTVRAAVLRQIDKVPEALTIQADEYIFTLAAVLSDVMVLRESLTFYRLHSGNAFQISDGNKQALRRKQNVLESLAASLTARLGE